MAHTITIRVVNKSEWKYEGEWGWWDPSKLEILLCRQPRTQLRHSLWHEVVHAALDLMGEYKLSRDEGFVDRFGGLLAQIMDTAEI